MSVKLSFSNLKSDASIVMSKKSSPIDGEASEQYNSIAVLMTRLPGIVDNKMSTFNKLNKAVVQALITLTDLIEDMKGNSIPRHEILLILHKVVGNLAPAVDVNILDNDDDSYGEEEDDVQIPKEVQNWIQATFMNMDSSVRKQSKLKSFTGKERQRSFIGIYSKKPNEQIPITGLVAIPKEAKAYLDSNLLWQFDTFKLQKLCRGYALKHTLLHFFQKYYMFQYFKIDGNHFNAFMNHIEFGYERYRNSYHNSLHGTDVLYTIHSLLIINHVDNSLSKLEMFAVLFSAAIHDYDHQGVTNNFIIENKYQLSTIYNDSAVQENHHISAAFSLLRKPFLNITAKFSKEQFSEFRSLCIKMVLGTDMSCHFVQNKRFQTLMQMKEELKISDYLTNLLHTADLSNPAKEWKIHLKWVIKITEEFFKQGDKEKALGLPISPLCDRNSSHIFPSQIGFLDFIIQPTYELYSTLTEYYLFQLNDSKDINITSINSFKQTSNLKIKYNFCTNRPWEYCIMKNRSNWRRREDKDYIEMKEKMESPCKKVENGDEK